MKENDQLLIVEFNLEKIITLTTQFVIEGEDEVIKFTKMNEFIHTYPQNKLECVIHIIIDVFKNYFVEKITNSYDTLELENNNNGEYKKSLKNMNEYFRNHVLIMNKENSGLKSEKEEILATLARELDKKKRCTKEP